MRSCDAFAHVLNFGQYYVYKGLVARGQCQSMRPACASSRLQPLDSCGHAVVNSVCMDLGCGFGKPADVSSDLACCRLDTYAAILGATLRKSGTCVRDSKCSFPKGKSMYDGRCRCNSGSHVASRRASWNCSLDAGVSRPQYARNPLYSENIYARYYRINISRDRPVGKSLSGGGSSEHGTIGLRIALPRLIELLDIESIIDIPCGDFSFMQQILGSETVRTRTLKYTGLDVVRRLVVQLQHAFGSDSGNRRVEFAAADISTITLWPVDLIIVRDLLFHFDANRALDVLQRISLTGSKYLLTSTYPTQNNSDAHTAFTPGRGFGSFWPINLQDAPFSLREPLLALGMDGQLWHRETHKRVVALWRLPLWDCGSSSGDRGHPCG